MAWKKTLPTGIQPMTYTVLPRTNTAKNLSQNNPGLPKILGRTQEQVFFQISFSTKFFPWNSASKWRLIWGGSHFPVLPWIPPSGLWDCDTPPTSFQAHPLIKSWNNLCIPWDVLMMVWMTMMMHCWESQNLFDFSCHLQGNQVHSRLWVVNLHPAIN